MKNKLIKRTAAAALAVLLAFTLTACDSFEQKLQGLIEATMFMAGEPNLNTSAVVTLRFSDDAEPVSLADFIQAVAGSESPEVLKGMEIALEVTIAVYADNMALKVYWLNGDDREEMMSMVYLGEDVYIGTGMLEFAGAIDDELAGLLAPMFGGADYLHISGSSMFGDSGMMGPAGLLGGEAILPDFDTDLAEKISAFQGDLSAALQTAIEQLLTEEFDESLSVANGEYILSLNTEMAVRFTKAALELFLEHDREIVEYMLGAVNDLFGEELFSESDIEEGLAEAVSAVNEALAFMATDEFTSNVPEVNFEYRVKATGEGADKVQTSSMRLDMPASAMQVLELPFDKFELSISEVVAIQTTPITAPQGVTVSLDDIMGDMFGGMMGFAGDMFAAMPDDIDFESILGGLDLGQILAELEDVFDGTDAAEHIDDILAGLFGFVN